MEGYSFASVQKIKTLGTMVSKFNHNCRQVEVSNADKSKADLNEDLIKLPEGMNYADAYRERVRDITGPCGRRIRKDAVKGYEVVLTYTRDADIDVEEWKRLSVQWLKDYFNVAGDGKDNVLHATFHGDETGNAHIHAFVVPIDERGHLCATSFTNGSRALSDLQSSYAYS